MNFAFSSAVRWLRESPEISRKKNETVSRRKKRILAILGSVFCAIFVKIYCFFAIYVVFIHFSPPQAKKNYRLIFIFSPKILLSEEIWATIPRVSNLPQAGIVANRLFDPKKIYVFPPAAGSLRTEKQRFGGVLIIKFATFQVYTPCFCFILSL